MHSCVLKIPLWKTGESLHHRHDLPDWEESAQAGGDAGGLGGQQWHNGDGGRAGQQARPHLENQNRPKGKQKAVTPMFWQTLTGSQQAGFTANPPASNSKAL